MQNGGLNIEVFAKNQGKPIEYIKDLADKFFNGRLPERNPHISFEAFIYGYEYRIEQELNKS
jgi:hypothetical protein